MRISFATAVRAAALLVLGTGVAGNASAAKSVDKTSSAKASAATDTAPAAEKRFDPGVMPEVEAPSLPLGYRYADLSTTEAAALRRDFKLPLDALATAKSPQDLIGSAVVAPLPDPNRPLLAVSAADELASNPFADSEAISFRRDPLKALGAMLGAADAKPAGKPAADAAGPVEDDPFGAAADATSPAAEKPQAEVDAAADPFGTGDDPFGLSDDAGADEEDPFGGF